MKHWGMAAALLVAGILVNVWMVRLILIAIAIMFMRDTYRKQYTAYKLDEEGIEVLYRGNRKDYIPWKELEYVITKNGKWLVVSDGNKKITLTDGIENLPQLACDVIDYNRKNKNLIVDPNVPRCFPVDIKVNDRFNISE